MTTTPFKKQADRQKLPLCSPDCKAVTRLFRRSPSSEGVGAGPCPGRRARQETRIVSNTSKTQAFHTAGTWYFLS